MEPATLLLSRVYNGENSVELPYRLSTITVHNLSGYSKKFVLMIKVMIEYF